MPRIDAIDEVIIDSPPMVVFKAILDEVAGVTHWWMPYMEFKLRGDIPIDREGAIYDATISPTSRMNAKFSAKMTKIVEGKLLEEEVAGCFVGTASWTFEPTDGKTKAQHRFNARTNGILYSLFSPFVDYRKNHSDIMEKGFKALNSYLKEMNRTK
jgi:uncharacterized protein YndB with AHSA1/START domain